MANWISDTFSSDAKEDDIVKSRSLNITRITGVVLPATVAIVTVITDQLDKPPFNDAAFQRHVFLAFVALIAAVTVADIFGRSIATRAQQAVATVLPKAIPARKDVTPGDDIDGHVLAFRTLGDSEAQSEYLFVPSGDGKVPSWEGAAKIIFR